MQPRHPRRPDGTRKIQGIDDLIREAVEDLPIHRLPGGEVPIDLSDYFASSPEQRVGEKLLLDNQMPPQPLAERRRLERGLEEAEGFLRGQRPILRRTLRHAAAQARLLAEHGNADQLQSLLEPFSLPLCFERKVTGEANAPTDSDRILVDALVQSVEQYNRRRTDVANRYRQFADRIVEGIRRNSAWGEGVAANPDSESGSSGFPCLDGSRVPCPADHSQGPSGWSQTQPRLRFAYWMATVARFFLTPNG